jgi:hypothetical protein
MTTDQIDAIKVTIAADIDAAAGIASTLAPGYAPLIALGRAAAKLIGPAAFEDIVKLVQKNQPTDADAVVLAKEIAGLGHPETL